MEIVSTDNNYNHGDAFTLTNAVGVIAQQISPFGGAEDENINCWVERIDQIAEIHRVAPGAVLLAASSRLIKEAKTWYEFQTGPVLRSWQALKEALVRVFENRVPFYLQMQKIESRRWIYSKETFQAYAINKLALIKQLKLPVRDSINLLVGGIGKASLRATAATTRAETVEEFLEEMRKITAASSKYPKKYAGTNLRTFKPRSRKQRQSNQRYDASTARRRGTGG